MSEATEHDEWLDGKCSVCGRKRRYCPAGGIYRRYCPAGGIYREPEIVCFVCGKELTVGEIIVVIVTDEGSRFVHENCVDRSSTAKEKAS